MVLEALALALMLMRVIFPVPRASFASFRVTIFLISGPPSVRPMIPISRDFLLVILSSLITTISIFPFSGGFSVGFLMVIVIFLLETRLLISGASPMEVLCLVL